MPPLGSLRGCVCLSVVVVFLLFLFSFVPLRVRERSDSRSSRRPVIGESQATLTALGVGGCIPSVVIRLDGLDYVHLCA